jgi:hypothetical protein
MRQVTEIYASRKHGCVAEPIRKKGTSKNKGVPFLQIIRIRWVVMNLQKLLIPLAIAETATCIWRPV